MHGFDAGTGVTCGAAEMPISEVAEWMILYEFLHRVQVVN